MPEIELALAVETRYVRRMEATINRQRKMGIEIECVLPIIGRGSNEDVQSLLAQVLSNHGVQACSRGYTHRSLPADCRLAIEHDTSIRDESRYRGLTWSKIEAKTAPMLWEEVERIMPQALDIIRYCGARTNASCGLHVHHHLPEAKDRPQVVKSLQHLWWRFHPVMFGLVAPSRKTNMYCRPPRREEARSLDSCNTYDAVRGKLARADRYCGLNLANLANQDRLTVEWRFHSGTTDWSKIKPWILATQRWVEHAVTRSCHYKPEPMSNTQAGLNSLLVTTGLKTNSRIYNKIDKDVRQAGRYLLRRWKHFNSSADFKAAVQAA